jgi:hypothetical protein|tara:strand:+ start:575 stop:802 length:228 start_codon:yes stop_codon:yes gene_type:complete
MSKMFKKLKKLLWETAEILGLVLAVAVLISSLFGPDVPFFGGIMANVQGVIQALGSSGLGLIIAVMIILNIWKRR